MKEEILFLPILLHLATAVLTLFFWLKPRIQEWVSVVANGLGLTLACILFFHPTYNHNMFVQAGNWIPPYGISLFADNFTKVLLILTNLVALSISLYSIVGIGESRKKFGYYPSVHFLLMGLSGAFLTGDIFNLYVWFEIVIISSFVLVSLGADKERLQASVPYVSMNLLASVIFLTGIAILYGLTGSLNMADLHTQTPKIPSDSLRQICAVFFIVGFGMKSAVFPLYFWLPSSYHTPPAGIAALFGGLLTKLGIYALVRTFTLIFIPDYHLATLLEWIAVLTLITGALGALVQTNLRKMLSYLIVCHIGFMVGGLSMKTESGLTGTIYYLMHDIPAKANLFLIAGLLLKICGSFSYDKMGGVQKNFPKLALVVGLSYFAVAGIPPLSGFFPKIFLFKSSLFHSEPLTIAMLIGSFLTVFSMAKMWKEVFWKEHPENKELTLHFTPKKWFFISLSIGILLIFSLFLGFGADYFMSLSSSIAKELLNPQIYYQTVFPEGVISP